MDGDFRSRGFSNLPPVIKNLLIINVIMFLATWVLKNRMHIDLDNILGLHYYSATDFRPYQFVTYLFMHGDIMHLFFNMFAVWMFGSTLENHWGSKRFLQYYLITGFGAGLVQYGVFYFQIQKLDEEVNYFIQLHGSSVYEETMATREMVINRMVVIGASGSLFGILLAFGMMFPNTMLMMIFVPIPIKAKYFVAIYGLIELFSGITNDPRDNVAHFAHLGGMLFGFIIILIWKRNRNFFY
jgi:membrane associated rhomboid family serine protease